MMEKYINQIKALENPSFIQIRQVAKNNCGKNCPGIKECLPWLNLDHGVALIDSHEDLCKYLCAYGEMHEEKMVTAFNSINKDIHLFNQEFTIIDWGCGQGLATICLFDFLNINQIQNQTKQVILVEPSKMALDRAKLHVNSYLSSVNKTKLINKYLDDVINEDIETDTNVVLHFFSNILDIASIDLKKLAQKVASDDSKEQYIFCVSPLNYGNHRVEAFYKYFNEPKKIAYEALSSLPKTKKTLKLLTFKLEAGKINLIQLEYYPPVQFYASYQLDCVKNYVKTLSDKDKQQYDLNCAFEVSAPFDIGARIYDDVNPIYAVLNNIITRGRPTRTSPFIEHKFKEFGNQREVDELGNISFINPKFQFIDLFSEIEYLSPIAIARVQKTVLEALMTEKITIEKGEWNVLVIERDVPCAAIAFDDLRQMFEHLSSLSKEYSGMKFPKVNLIIISNQNFVNSSLHLNYMAITEVTNQIRFKEFDMVIDISVILGSDTLNVSFSEFKCKNNCYFSIRSSKQINKNRNIYTSDAIEYHPLVTKDAQGNYQDISETKEHLLYFLQLLFRKEDFRPGQLPILDRALQNKSVIGLLPTGGGKSLTYQLAGMLQPGVTIVIDPLRSLMKDQYDGLINYGIDTCTYINSTLSLKENDEREKQMESSQIQFVFLSPEKLCIYKFRDRLQTMRDLHVYFSYGVIDEVHCVSEWGHDFRFSYLHLGRNLYNYVLPKNQDKRLTLFGLTATASFDVLADVERELSGNGAFPLETDTIIRFENTNRLELQYKIEKIKVNQANNQWDIYKAKNKSIAQHISQLPDLINELQTNDSIKFLKEKFIERENLIDNFNGKEIRNILESNLKTDLSEDWFKIKNNFEHGGIVFCPHRRGSLGIECSDANRGIARAIREDLNCKLIGTFKGGDGTDDQDKFINNELPLMVATKAFGMGIDKSNVRFTININMCSSLEGFVQEAGRAGRDRKMALATILYSDYKDVDRDVQMYFFDNNFKGIEHEKKVMHELLSKKSLYYSISHEDSYEVQETNTISGFLTTLLSLQNNQNMVSYISYIDDANYEGIDKYDYVAKAIYRMCCVALIDDFTQDYNKKRFRIVTKRKADGDYYKALKQFLMRYYSVDRAEAEIQKVPVRRGDNEVHKCLSYLTEFIYDKIAIKRKRAIDDMRTFCIQGLDVNKDWKEVNEDLKDFIYYYFNSKYAKDDYIADNDEPFSLTKDTDRGKLSLPDIVLKFIRVVDDDIVGAGGTPKDNVKHLQGAVRLIRRSLTDKNPALDLLNSFCLQYLGTNNNETLEEELQRSYKDGLIGFFENTSNYKKFWYFFENYHDNIFQRLNEFRIDRLNEIKAEITANIHAKIIKSLTNKYTT